MNNNFSSGIGMGNGYSSNGETPDPFKEQRDRIERLNAVYSISGTVPREDMEWLLSIAAERFKKPGPLTAKFVPFDDLYTMG